MPRMAGPLVKHRFHKTTIVGNSHVFFPGEVELPEYVLAQHKRELEAEKRRKTQEGEEMGLTAEEMADLETQRQANDDDETDGEGADKDEE